MFDKQNNNTLWADAIKLERDDMQLHDVFKDIGLVTKVGIPVGFKKIRVHMVFDVKHDGRHKARLVADGSLTPVPLSGVYAGVVSIRGFRICILLGEMNNLQPYATDVSSAYLMATTSEKVCIIGGPEFGELQGHLLIIYKALYGLRTSGKQFGDLLSGYLQELGFTPSLAEPQIFMRKNEGLYEYVATYVDDLCLIMRDPESLIRQLEESPSNLKFKGSGPVKYHLGCGFERGADGTLEMNPVKFINKMAVGYEQMFNEPMTGRKIQSPLSPNDHPELDNSSLLDEDDIQKYQSLIGSLQWLITLGRWDIQTQVMSMSSFRAMPRQGHLERVKRICKCVNQFKHFTIKFRPYAPDLSMLDNRERPEWSNIYGECFEEVPSDAPTPLGKPVTFIHYFDASLMHDVISGKAVTGCIHFANGTPIMWHSKKQATVETATYGAEFCAGRT